MPLVVPLVAVPSQTLSIGLGNQPCAIDVFTKHLQVPVIGGPGVTSPPQGGGAILTSPPDYGEIDPVFLNLRLNDELVLSGALARNNVGLIRGYCATEPVFLGELSFTDTQANEEPRWDGLGSRWLLLYWPPE